MYDITLKAIKKRLIEEALESERSELICCGYYTRTSFRKDHRNGYWRRYILLKDGCLYIKMPRIRSKGYDSHIIPRYKQRMPEVDETLKKIFLYGASTRLTGEALRPLLGESISAQTVSNIAKSLDEEVRAFHHRPLEDTYRYLFFDGIVLKVKTGFGSKKKITLVAYGITVYGKRELIDFMVTKNESEHSWEVFLENLYKRGLKGMPLHLIITDGNQGLINTVEMVYPHIPRQRCFAHKLRNVANCLKKRYRDNCIREARSIYNAKDRKEAIETYFRWAKRWRTISEKAVRCIERDLEELLNFYSCPEPMRKNSEQQM